MTTAISIKNLRFGYTDTSGWYQKHKRPHPDPDLILSDVSLDIPRSMITALLGANGAGKTTLLYLMLGLYLPLSGSIDRYTPSGGECSDQSLKQVIGMVSQDESIPFDLSAREYVLLGRAPFLKLLELPDQKDRDIAQAALETVGMARLADHALPRLSSGEKQLVNVARVLAQSPEILLFDEPCSHLDLINTRQILKLMKTIADKGKTIVFTTHDPNAAAAVADQVVLLQGGRIIGTGLPSETLTGELLTQTYGEAVTVTRTPDGPVVLAI